jgi:hypothetical protein
MYIYNFKLISAAGRAFSEADFLLSITGVAYFCSRYSLILLFCKLISAAGIFAAGVADLCHWYSLFLSLFRTLCAKRIHK